MALEQDIITKLDKLLEIASDKTAWYGSIASIISLVFTLINTLMIFHIWRRFKNRKALSFIVKELEKNQDILMKKDVPADLVKRVHALVDDVGKYKIMTFAFTLKAFIKDIKSFNELTEDNKKMFSNKITLIINELREP
jgi:hypothetical protein